MVLERCLLLRIFLGLRGDSLRTTRLFDFLVFACAALFQPCQTQRDI
jgi:hypothetical protein